MINFSTFIIDVTKFFLDSLDIIKHIIPIGYQYRNAKVPTLDETLECLKGRTKLYVDAKAIPAEALAAKLEQYGLVDQAVVYQSPGYLRELRSINPAIRRLCPLSEAGRIDALIESVRPYAFDSSWNILSLEMINRCHELDVKVFSDAMGENERIEAYIRAMEWGTGSDSRVAKLSSR